MSKIWRIFAIWAMLIIVTDYATVSYGSTNESKVDEKQDKISLEAPSFLSIDWDGTSFLEEEAEISAYTNVGEAIDLEKAKTAFRTIEDETDEYIIGSVPIPDYPEDEDVHAYVLEDGWIATYYLTEEPAAKIIDWNYYPPITTKIVEGIGVVCNAAGVPVGDIKYYDFRYPNANRLMIIIEALPYEHEAVDSFNIKLPGDFVFYERSFSHYLKTVGYSSSTMYIDGKVISSGSHSGGETNYGLLSPMELSLDVFHTVKISCTYYCTAFGAIVLVYREP